MKSKKPNDPRRLTIAGFGKPKVHRDSIRIPIYVEYDPWCCIEAHEYANAFKAISDLFEDTADDKERREYIAAHLDGTADAILRDDFDKDKAVELLTSVAQYFRELGEEEYHND